MVDASIIVKALTIKCFALSQIKNIKFFVVGGGTYFDCLNYDTESGSWENSCDEVLAWKEEIS